VDDGARQPGTGGGARRDVPPVGSDHLREKTASLMGLPQESERLDDRGCFRDYLSRLSCAAGTFEIGSSPPASVGRRGLQAERASRPVRPGFLVHSLLGMGLRAVACALKPRCEGSCRRPGDCAYGRLLEPQPARSGLPLSGVARAPVPLAIDAPWGFYEPGEPLRFTVVLLGAAAALRDLVAEAIGVGFAKGIGPGLHPVSVAPLGWQDRSAAVTGEGDSGECRLRITLLSPLRLVRDKRELASFDLGSLVRDLGFRLAVWGHYHQGMEWPAPWRFLLEDAQDVRVACPDVRLVSFHRYSGRQGRAIPLKGLLGTIVLAGVSPDLALLLRAGEVCGIGKGASIGLGRIRISLD